MKKLFLLMTMVFLSLSVTGCNVSDEAKFFECLARDKTSNPCN